MTCRLPVDQWKERQGQPLNFFNQRRKIFFFFPLPFPSNGDSGSWKVAPADFA
jgi:hypothetical protein